MEQRTRYLCLTRRELLMTLGSGMAVAARAMKDDALSLSVRQSRRAVYASIAQEAHGTMEPRLSKQVLNAFLDHPWYEAM